jgi:PPM family protein phosphatase
MILAAHGVSHQGRRSSNEDSLLVDPSRALFVVADGMGGHNAGEVASELAVRTISEFVNDGSQSEESQLGTAVQLANERIYEAATQSPECSGMGTTVSLARITSERLLFANVGDSRIYRVHDGVLTQLTRDDSWISHALATGVPLTATEIEVHPMRHVLTEVVGVRTDIEIEVHTCDLEAGDMLLICTDGLHGVMPDEALLFTLRTPRPVAAIAESLVEQALTRGGTDNITAIVVRCEP